MAEVLIYLVIVLGFAFMMYQTHRLSVELKWTYRRGEKKLTYLFITLISFLWLLYIAMLIYALISI